MHAFALYSAYLVLLLGYALKAYTKREFRLPFPPRILLYMLDVSLLGSSHLSKTSPPYLYMLPFRVFHSIPFRIPF